MIDGIWDDQAVSAICDAKGTASAYQHGIAGLDGAHQSQI
jgi:hypothetical protein